MYQKVRDHCHCTGKVRGAARSICNLRCRVPKKIPVVSHNGSAYDWHFTIKLFPEVFKSKFECLGENIEKYTTFSIPIIKEVANDDDGKKEEEDDYDDKESDCDSEEEEEDDDGKEKDDNDS